MEVVWCRICEKNRELCCLDDYESNYLGCNVCGLVLRTDDFADPESPAKQHPVHTCAQDLGISDEYAIQDAMVCYKKAASGHFQCRPTIVAAICLYIGCRANEIPIMLFDLSIDMCVSVYYLGLMFLDVCEFLTDQIHGFWPPKIVDPVFFIHRLENNNNNNFNVLLTALRILAAIKSNYVGRRKRLAGLCAAAVYMAAANFNGLDVDNAVPAFEPILSHKYLVKCRILDLAYEFRSVAEEYNKLFLNGGEEEDYIMGNVEEDVLCPHNNVEMFCHGFCHACYNKFVKLSGYFGGGSDEAMKLKNSRKCPPTDLENGIAVPRQDDDVQVLCGKKKKTLLSSIINFDALRQVFGDDVAQSKESNGTSSNAMEQGQAREENWGYELANGGGDAQGREDSANKDDQREEVLANKVRRPFGQPKRPWVLESISSASYSEFEFYWGLGIARRI